MASVSHDNVIELDVEKFTGEGQAFARVDGYVVFVEGAVPGDRVKAYVHRARS